MAISATHYHLLKELREQGVLPRGGRILEIGQANFYGDMDLSTIDGRDGMVPATILSGALCQKRGEPIQMDAQFAIVRSMYKILMDPQGIVSLDADPNAPNATNCDLNELVVSASYGEFSVAINHGTAEHIFNIANVFRLMHDATVEGGLMIHESPFTGWVDHGFYCLQPTLFYDLAAANGYEIVLVALEHLKSRSIHKIACREQIHEMRRQETLPDDAMLFVVFRKGADAPFKVPMQGIYNGTVSSATQEAWRSLR